MANVDLHANDKNRGKVLWNLIEQVTDDMDQSDRLNIGRFMIHVAWHEGDRLKTREQYGGGPGRSFYQFEPVRAKEAVQYAEAKRWLKKLADAAGNTEQEIKNAGRQLPTAGSTWPGGNLIEEILRTGEFTSDLFATYLIRIALKKIPQPIASGNDNHAVYWADHWKRVFASPQDRARQIAIVKSEADAVDRILDSL